MVESLPLVRREAGLDTIQHLKDSVPKASGIVTDYETVIKMILRKP